MVSDSESCAGQHDHRRLEAALAQELHRLAPVHVGQPDVHDHEVDRLRRAPLHALGGVRLLGGLELLVERQLLDEAFAQRVVVIDDQDLSDGHGAPLSLGSWTGPKPAESLWNRPRQDVDPNRPRAQGDAAGHG